MANGCRSCGFNLNGTESFCPGCGTKINLPFPPPFNEKKFKRQNLGASSSYNSREKRLSQNSSESYYQGGVSTSYHNERKGKKTKFFIWAIIAGIFLFAFATNPSKSESSSIIKEMVLEEFNNKMKEKMTDENTDGWGQIGSFIGSAFSSYIYDYLVKTKVTNYYIFSTFSSQIKLSKEEKTLISGVIVFGKVIPLDSDFKDIENLEDLQKLIL